MAKTLSVEEAQLVLGRARAAERSAQLVKEARAKREQAKRIEVSNEKFRKAENAKLARMILLTVKSVEYDGAQEGTIRFEFTDGTVFSITAQGDDATSICYSFDGEDGRG
jgi:predicted 2-oxoglutarate/Fe(II)-dependent dioxygenase YbiX